MARMKEAGIQTSIHYPPVHSFSANRQAGQSLPRTEALAGRLLTLPFFPGLTEQEVDLVVRCLLEAVRT
jgi:dTDP-4-amino-4,6-dideoxygalactose transaminase